MTTPHGRPTAPELLDAVIEHLTGTLLPTVPAERAYPLRVAIAALEIVARELAAPAPPAPLAIAGIDGPAAVSAAIRHRQLADEQLVGARREISADVEARLAVTRPPRGEMTP